MGNNSSILYAGQNKLISSRAQDSGHSGTTASSKAQQKKDEEEGKHIKHLDCAECFNQVERIRVMGEYRGLRASTRGHLVDAEE
jgi:hypothetical protein